MLEQAVDDVQELVHDSSYDDGGWLALGCQTRCELLADPRFSVWLS